MSSFLGRCNNSADCQGESAAKPSAETPNFNGLHYQQLFLSGDGSLAAVMRLPDQTLLPFDVTEPGIAAFALSLLPPGGHRLTCMLCLI